MRPLAPACAVLFLAACQSAPSAPEPAAPAPLVAEVPAAPVASAAPESPVSAPAPEAPAAPSDWRLEMSGAPYPRATTDTLAVLVPREPSGGESDAHARAAFEALSPEEQLDLIAWFDSECRRLATFQESLIRYVVDGAERDASSWPDLGPLTWYDPAVHCPAQPIPRRPLAPDFPEVQGVRNQILGAAGSRALDSGWMVDYGQRSLVRLPRQGDARRVFENGLLGMAPDWDLAEALVELALDDGSLQKSFQAFGHAYTDRWGGVYPGITLYDAHASRGQIEMPDVDTLGLVHDLLDDWTTWVAPVRGDQQQDLYTRIAELFREVFRHRGLRQNLARTYLRGNAELRDLYANNLDNFHALWESCASDPATLRARLPDPASWQGFLQSWNDELVADPQPYYRGTDRHATLDRNAQAVRATLLRLLGEYGAYARIETLPAYDQ